MQATARLAAGRKTRGGNRAPGLDAHHAEIADLERTLKELRARPVLRDALAVIVLDRDGIQAAPRRQQDLMVVLELLCER
ncbi:MAG: hypothetical protein IPO81_19090 [Kouleothrix sp.]|nr:hypothetical protein [Kouleothrix sp.]